MAGGLAAMSFADRLGQCARNRTARCGGTYYGRMTNAGAGCPGPAAVIRRTVAVIRLRDRLGRYARDRTGVGGGTYYGRMTNRRERIGWASAPGTARPDAAGHTTAV